MAFSDLQPNQMVDENNASTSGFASIGAKLSPANKCYTKAEALATYSLNASAMDSYANNQLVPKSVWVNGLPPTIISMAYTGTNSIGGYNSVFSTARTNASSSSSGSAPISCFQIAGSYQIERAFCGFNTSSITTAISGGIQINVFVNHLVNPVQFAVVRTTTNFPANHVWVLADYAQSNGGVLETTPVTINPGQTGIINFPFNATGLAYINGSNDCTFVIIQYTNDGLNVAPISAGDVYQNISTSTSDIKLYYS